MLLNTVVGFLVTLSTCLHVNIYSVCKEYVGNAKVQLPNFNKLVWHLNSHFCVIYRNGLRAIWSLWIITKCWERVTDKNLKALQF